MIILQSRLSGLYFKDFGLWVAHLAEAHRFTTLDSARQFISSHHVSDVALRDASEMETLTIGSVPPPTDQKTRKGPALARQKWETSLR